ncbi:hypothetical protein UlMin_041298 [Ulmus minor]
MQVRDYQETEPVLPAVSDVYTGTGSSTHENFVPFVDGSDLPIAQGKGVRECIAHPIEKYVAFRKLLPSYKAFVSNLDGVQIPTTIQEALKVPTWKKAMEDEIWVLESNGTWTLTELPYGKKLVGCKWIFTVKYKADGSIERFKAKLVAKGFTQSYGIDYQETFAPIYKLNTVWVLLSLAVNQDWPLHQLDVKNAFLNGDLEEEVCMTVPPSLENSTNSRMVCKLKKSLYGLKQSPRAWFNRFAKAVIANGYSQCQADHTLFLKYSPEDKIAILIVYVDDIILIENNAGELIELKKLLAAEFEIKDLGALRYFLGMEVA